MTKTHKAIRHDVFGSSKQKPPMKILLLSLSLLKIKVTQTIVSCCIYCTTERNKKRVSYKTVVFPLRTINYLT